MTPGIGMVSGILLVLLLGGARSPLSDLGPPSSLLGGAMSPLSDLGPPSSLLGGAMSPLSDLGPPSSKQMSKQMPKAHPMQMPGVITSLF